MAEVTENVKAERDAVVQKLESLQAKIETSILENAYRPLLEDYDLPPRAKDPFRYADPGNPVGVARHAHRTLPRDREDGKYFPYYEREVDLAIMRATSRELEAYFPRVLSVLEMLGDYVFGEGFTYTVQAKPKVNAPEDLIVRAQTVIDEFNDHNDWTGVGDLENDRRARGDGESIIVLEENPSGPPDLEFVEPDYLTEPVRKVELSDSLQVKGRHSWSFGVLTKHRKSRPIAYHFVFDGVGRDWDVKDANHVVHTKRNVIRSAKRGVSDYFTNRKDIENEEKLRENTGVGAAVQAAIAFIRQHRQGTTPEGISSYLSGIATNSFSHTGRDGSTQTRQVEQLRPGTVKDIPEGMEYQAGPLGTLRSPVFVEVAQFLLRALAGRWAFPEYMISGDASNANFSSTLVSESPFVKARERDQRFYKKHDSTMLWKVLRIAWAQGRLTDRWNWRDVVGMLEINIHAPEAASRDKLKIAQTNAVEFQNGILSRRTWATESGRDFDEETENRQKDGDNEFKPDVPGVPGEGEEQTDEVWRSEEDVTIKVTGQQLSEILNQEAEDYP